MALTTDDIIDGIIRREGSTYTNRKNDRGGPTRFGVTLATLRDYHHDDAVTAEEVEHLTEAEARAIYKTMYVERPGFDRIATDALRAFLVDWGVTSGPRTAIKHLQRLLGVAEDGILGPYTVRKANAADQRSLYVALIDDRDAFVKAIVAHDASQEENLNGWLNRNHSFRDVAVLA